MNVTDLAMTLPPVMEFGRLHMADVSGGSGTNVLSRSLLDLMRTPQMRKNKHG